jgi:hypothetical protein
MVRTERRQFLKAAGAGTGIALGAGAASAQGSSEVSTSQNREVITSFTATATGGYITINGDDKQASNDNGSRLELTGPGVNGDLIIEGDVYSDKTWESTNIDFPGFNLDQLVDPGDLPIDPSNINEDITVTVDPISGTFDPAAGLITGDITLTVDVFLEINVIITIEREFQVVIPGDTADPIPLTTKQSGSLQGSASNLDGSNASATLVSNEFIIEATNETIGNPIGDDINVDNELNLPSDDPSRNYIELQLDLAWGNQGPPTELLPPIPDPIEPGFEGPPKDEDGDGLLENVRGGQGPPSVLDVQALFDNLNNPNIQNNSDKFNFQGDDPNSVGVLDVQALYDKHVNN